MKWLPGGESQDIEDHCDASGGGGGGFQFGGMHIGIGGAILILILNYVFKTNLFALLGGEPLIRGRRLSAVQTLLAMRARNH